MLPENIKDQNFDLKEIESLSVDDKLYYLDELLLLDNVDQYCNFICALIEDEDKGVRNASVMVITSKKPVDAPAKLAPFVSNNKIQLRNLVGEVLIRVGEDVIDPLIEYSVGKNDDDQKFIIDIFGMIGSQQAVSHILSVLSSNENDNVILACIEALGNIKYEDSVDILLLLYGRNELYVPSVVEALGKIGSEKALNFLMEKFPNEEDLIKYSILESLGSIGDVETFFFLLEKVAEIHGPLVWPLITSLFLLKEKFDLDIPFDDRMKNLLMYTLQEGNPEHKKIALSLINVFNDKDILITSLKFLGEDYELDEIIKSKMYRNTEYLFEEFPRIVSTKPANLLNILNLFLSVTEYTINELPEQNLQLVQKRNIVYAVSDCLNYHDEEVRRAAMELLFLLDTESALLFIDSMINDENLWNRLRLLEILDNIYSPDVTEIIEKFSGDPEEMVRERAAEILSSKSNNNIHPLSR
ncbi:MAG: HEAT repeat domain-containing protein [Melioribacteraceae bacterium]